MVQADPIWKKFLGTAVDAIGRCLYGFLRNTGLLKNQRPELRNIQPKRILVIRTDSLGDVLLTTPLFRALKQKYPKTKVCALVRQGFREVLADNPHVDQIITHDVPWGKERSPWPVKIRIFCSWKTLTYPLKLIRIICLLRAQQFDLGIELNGDLRNILFFLVAVKIPNRLGFNRTGGEYLLAGSVEYNIYENQIKNNARLIYKLGKKFNAGRRKILPIWERSY
jgi:heptosyltransferase-3